MACADGLQAHSNVAERARVEGRLGTRPSRVPTIDPLDHEAKHGSWYQEFMGMSSTGPKSSDALDNEPIEPLSDLTSFFDETLRSALSVRKLEPPEATTRYLTTLLADLGHEQGTVGEASLLELELQAQAATRSTRLMRLRTLGDHALSYGGLFDAHRERRGVSEAYLTDVGSRAYRKAFALSREYDDERSGDALVFLELGTRFSTYRAVLDDVREATSLGTADDILSLYERYMRTRSPALRKRLASHGVFALDLPRTDEPT